LHSAKNFAGLEYEPEFRQSLLSKTNAGFSSVGLPLPHDFQIPYHFSFNGCKDGEIA
jgi:hypothetical protein